MTQSTHPLYDDYRQWPTAYEQPLFNVRQFQRKIDKIVGKTIDNQPIIRLIWSWKSREYISGDWRAKYRFMTVDVPDGVIDICPPRWILEERYEPAQYIQAWEAGRYFTDPETGTIVDLRGPAPREGWYGYLELIATHDKDKACCDYLWNTEQRRCWGFYREPAQADLDAIKRAKYLRDKEPFKQSPHEPISEQTLAEIGREAFTRQQEAKEKRTSDLALRFGDQMRTHGHRLNVQFVNGNLVIRQAEDPGRRFERFHILGG